MPQQLLPSLSRDLKKHFTSHTAKLILGETKVLEEAPMAMILAGLGDYLGKVTATMDW